MLGSVRSGASVRVLAVVQHGNVLVEITNKLFAVFYIIVLKNVVRDWVFLFFSPVN
jgi:hypothetical protein